MQTIFKTLISNQNCMIQTARIICSLGHNEMNSLLADIEYSRSGHCEKYSEGTQHFLGKCKDILSTSDTFAMPSATRDEHGNSVIFFDYKGSEGEFWMSHILSSEFIPIVQRSAQSIIYAHPIDKRLIEFDEHVVYVRFGERNSLISYLSEVCFSKDGPFKCLFSPTYFISKSKN